MNVLKSAVRAALLTPIRRLRKRARKAQRKRDEHGLLRHAQLVVHSGPFTGMSLQGAISPIGPKVLGTHEIELNALVESLCRSDIQHIVNVGGADGFYAIGMLRHLERARGTVFEMVASHHESIVQMASANGVLDRLTVKGTCDVASLASVLRGGERALVLMDVEGAEREILDPDAIPSLRHASVLVELHDFVDPRVSSAIRRRFEPTHRITVFQSRPRRVEELPAIEGMGISTMLRLADEGRPAQMQWFYLEPSASH